MIDLFLHAPSLADMAAGLALVGLSVNGEMVPASHTHALAVVVDDTAGVIVAVRCLEDALAGAIRATSLAEVARPDGWAWAG